MIHTSSRREGFAAVGVALAALAMLAFTWKTWPDAINDAGRELYVAWQLASGQALYRDIAYFNGPLSPYLNAVWFAVFGPGIAVLETANGIVLAAIVALTWRLVRRVAGWGPAAAGVLVLVTVLAFGPLTTFGSFSYLLPYSHEMTHGLLLLLLLLTALDRFLRHGGRAPVTLAGALLGLIALTKPEFLIAGCATLLVGLGLVLYRPTANQRVGDLALLPFAAAAPSLVAWLALTTVMPSRVAFDGLMGSWPHLTSDALNAMPYFKFFMGTDRPLNSVILLLVWSVAWTAACAGAVLVSRILRGVGRFERPAAVVLAAISGALLLAGMYVFPWRDTFRPLPLISLAVFVWAVRVLVRTREGDPRAPQLILAAAAAAMSLALMLKMILFARIWHYGFALGMPATMLAVAALARGVPYVARRRGGRGFLAGSVMMGLLLGLIASHVLLIADQVKARTVPMGTGRDQFRSDARGLVVKAVLASVEQFAPDAATLAVLPEGVMINYLARRPNSTPYVIANPADVAIFGEARMLAAYQAAPPDFIALLGYDTSMFGFAGFGQGYADQLAAWIDANYAPAAAVRPNDVGEDGFRAVLLKRRVAEPAPAVEPSP